MYPFVSTSLDDKYNESDVCHVRGYNKCETVWHTHKNIARKMTLAHKS